MEELRVRINLQFFAGEKTEPATPKKRRDVRKKGQVFKSQDLVVAVSILVSFSILPKYLEIVRGYALSFLASSLSVSQIDQFTYHTVTDILFKSILVIGAFTLPLMLIVAVAGVLINVLQTGPLYVPSLLQPKFERINPLEGLKRMFSKRSLVNLLKSLLKVLIVGYIAYGALAANAAKVLTLGQVSLADAFYLIVDAISGVGVKVGFLLLVIGILDFLFQWWEYEKSIRMSKQEIKEEYKQTEGDPQIKARIRAKQRQLARARMVQAIPTADVVITNPTHVAVALRYEPEKGAPEVVAKGRGLLAAKIKEIAMEHDVPIVERPELARTIYKLAEIGQLIPPELYKAVAEVLAFVYKLKRKSI